MRHFYQCSKCNKKLFTKGTTITSIIECTRCNNEMTYYENRKSRYRDLEAEIVIYTDGACSPNPGYGGWAAILQCEKSGSIHEHTIFGSSLNTTNNRMEITAVLESMRYLDRPYHIIVYTDSKYAQQGIGNWENGNPGKMVGLIAGWCSRNWQKKDGTLIVNKDLWIKLHKEVKKHKSIRMRHIKGHTGHVFNERCNNLAIEARLNHEKLRDIY